MRRTLVTGMLLTLLLAGCGGDSDNAEPAGGPTTTVAAGPPTSGSTDTNFTGANSGPFCDMARKYGARRDQLTVSNPNQLRAVVTEAEAAIRDAVAVAPAEIKGDVQVVAAASAKFFKSLADANYDFTKVPPEGIS